MVVFCLVVLGWLCCTGVVVSVELLLEVTVVAEV